MYIASLSFLYQTLVKLQQLQQQLRSSTEAITNTPNPETLINNDYTLEMLYSNITEDLSTIFNILLKHLLINENITHQTLAAVMI
jgi:hypothetical protein